MLYDYAAQWYAVKYYFEFGTGAVVVFTKALFGCCGVLRE
jgi:hypothetical protein